MKNIMGVIINKTLAKLNCEQNDSARIILFQSIPESVMQKNIYSFLQFGFALGRRKITLFAFLLTCIIPAYTQSVSDSTKPLIIPLFLKKEQRIAGNPLATYSAMLKLENRYLTSPFKDIFIEQKKNMEEFLGFPLAGIQAMNQINNLKSNYGNKEETPDPAYEAWPAMKIITEEAKKHSIIIWGEEHHLPQTRSLYSLMVSELWKLGYRYLAAETFSDEMELPGFKYPGYNSGYYLMDPVFANAVRDALKLGYKLISYDNDDKERDKKQAENIKQKIFDKDPQAKVLILSGRGHISETVANGGWEPMGYWLKKLTGLDPFTIYAPTMTERLTREEEHPLYRYLTANGKIHGVTIFKNKISNDYYGKGSFDAYVFFPRVKIKEGRPDWLFKLPGRKSVNIKQKIPGAKGPLLLQAFPANESDSAIAIDQFVVSGPEINATLVLPNGKLRIRIIDSEGQVLFQKTILK
jgi:hypothetical protein